MLLKYIDRDSEYEIALRAAFMGYHFVSNKRRKMGEIESPSPPFNGLTMSRLFR